MKVLSCIRIAALATAMALSASCSSGDPARAKEAPGRQSQGLQVVELFQSQGCSSCPPANRNVLAIADRPDILALSWQVTYWDYLGWKDVFAQPAFTARQRAYAAALHHDRVWTPQVVVNGRGDVIGGNKAELDQALRRFGRNADQLRINLSADRAELSGPTNTDASVYLVRYDPRTIEVPIRAGENGGRTLPHRNVVRQLVLLGHYRGKAQGWNLPRAADKALRTAILVQSGSAGPILAASHD